MHTHSIRWKLGKQVLPHRSSSQTFADTFEHIDDGYMSSVLQEAYVLDGFQWMEINHSSCGSTIYNKIVFLIVPKFLIYVYVLN